jgi:hypothetical protein
MFSFLEVESYEENLGRFFEHVKELDPVLGQIFCDLAAGITIGESTDRSVMRSNINAQVVARLDAEPPEFGDATA